MQKSPATTQILPLKQNRAARAQTSWRNLQHTEDKHYQQTTVRVRFLCPYFSPKNTTLLKATVC